MMRAAAFAIGLAAAQALELPSANEHDVEALRASQGSKWWAKVGQRVFFAPPTSMMELGAGSGSGSYYYAVGSSEALTPAMKQHRVGGEGRVHIFYLPEGPSMLNVRSSGDRRASFSSLVQLQHGSSITEFPKYTPHEPQDLTGALKELEQTSASHIDAHSYESFLQQVVGIKTGKEVTRSWLNDAATKEAQQLLIGEFERMGLTACLQEFSHDGQKVANVVGFLPGTDRASGTLTVGAHYDSRPFDKENAPGAEDNGSGVAALLSVAEAFTKAKLKPKKNVYFVGFAAEEPGLVGSAAFAQSLKGHGPTTVPAKCLPSESSFLQVQRKLWSDSSAHSAIVLDEVGWISDRYKKDPTINFETRNTAGTTKLMDQLYSSNTANNKAPLNVVHNQDPFGSDHMSWLDNGMSAVLLINGDDEAYPHYHKSDDEIGNVNMEYGAKVSKVVLGGVIRAADVTP